MQTGTAGVSRKRDLSINNLANIATNLARQIRAIDLPHPTRVGIDGFCAAGKTTLADAIAAVLLESKIDSIRVSTDNFQNPPEIRWQLGAHSPEGFCRHAVDFGALKSEVLLPLGAGGSMRYRTSTYNIQTLEPDVSEQLVAPRDSVLIVDGLFLQSEALREHFDYMIFVDAPYETCITRARARNQERKEDADEVEEIYRQRYVPGYKLYVDEVRPHGLASTIVINNSPDIRMTDAHDHE